MNDMYESNGKRLLREYSNIFYLQFDDEGRCAAFTEWFMRRPQGDEGM